MFDVLKNRASIKSFVDATIENLLDNQPPSNLYMNSLEIVKKNVKLLTFTQNIVIGARIQEDMN